MNFVLLSLTELYLKQIMQVQVRIQRGGGTRGPDPPHPGKSQVIWVSIGNKQLDPPPPGKRKVGPPPPLENAGPPPEPLKMIVFYEFNNLTSVK